MLDFLTAMLPAWGWLALTIYYLAILTLLLLIGGYDA